MAESSVGWQVQALLRRWVPSPVQLLVASQGPCLLGCLALALVVWAAVWQVRY